MLGDWNWYLPSWLAWLPRIEVEGSAHPAQVPAPAAPREPVLLPEGLMAD